MAERRFTPLATPFEVELAGTRLIEAGAGTGKTWTIAALVLRLLLEHEIPVGGILVVTYTRAATGELAARIRRRLVEALAAFERGTADEPFLQALLGRHDPRLAAARLRLAIESFDEAAILTIHGFCQRALADSAFEAGHAFERELVPEPGALLEAAARDAWRRVMAEASPAWAAWLIDTFGGPEGLARRVRPHLGRANAALAAPEDDERSAAERDFATARAAALACWNRETVLAGLLAANLNKTSYRPEKLPVRAAALDRWFAGAPALPLPDGAALFGTEKIGKGYTKASQPVEHPFFAAMEALLAAAERLKRAFDAATRRFARDFLVAARIDVAERKRRAGEQSYDDLLADLAMALKGPGGPALVAGLRARYRAALVDEFQDTDLQQLDIFTAVFGDATHPLVFVGDPKQAIYGFRGADVFAYLDARRRAEAGYALLENRRSDPPLLEAVNALFAGPRAFLIDALPFEPARPAAMERTPCRIEDDCTPLTLWTLAPPAEGKSFPKEDAQTRAAAATAADIARLLALAAGGKARIGDRPLGGGDIAVLVRKRRQGIAVRDALARCGIASVSLGGGSVWQSAAAEEMERLLLAIAAPGRAGLVRAALATVLLGVDAAGLAALDADERAWNARVEACHDDLSLLRERGFMAMWRRLLRREGVVARVLARSDGERRLTDYRHLAELLQAAEHAGALDAAGLARHIARARLEAENDDNQLRLESDARLVRIVTIHAAKGLQYPVAYCPFLWDGPKEDAKVWPVVAHAEGSARLDFGSARIDALRAAADRESAAEELRLAYVALTRAEHRCVVVWAHANQSERSPLAWLLFGSRDAVGDAPPAGFKARPAPEEGNAASVPQAAVMPLLAARRFAATIPAPWRVQSFSALAARLDAAEAPDRDALAAVPPAPTFETRFSSIHAFPRGMRAGSCLHALFERVDFQRPETAGSHAAAALAEFAFPADWQPVLEKLVADVVAAPLDAAGMQLARVPRAECLVELEFAFPLGSTAAREGYMKGFIDLVFRQGGRWYIVDWKSNALDDYGPESLATAMRAHRYDMQARIYAAALRRALTLREPGQDWSAAFGGVFYLFLRGMGPDSPAGVHFLRPTHDELAEWLP
jgi:exodeoxyribonuclease V beta subunit